MSNSTNDLFYSNLKVQQLPLSELLKDKSFFSKVPEDWFVILTDIKNSTQAVNSGLHETVNLIATGSIITVLNFAHKKNIEIPFFFGGDGATMIVPESFLDHVLKSLKKHSLNAQKDFGMELRIGYISVSEIYKNDRNLYISKLQIDRSFCIPIVSGKGLIYAEDLIKAKEESFSQDETLETELDLTGMECRWNKIRPPKQTKEVVCLLVVIRDEKEDLKIYKKVIDALENIYGSKQERNPISIQGLELNPALKKIKTEMQVKFGAMNLPYLLKVCLKTLLAKLFFWRYSQSGKYYFKRLVELSDTLVLDGRISTVIAGTSQQRDLLITALDNLEEAEEIFYGIHISKESVMSCYVRDRQDQHIHFIDGSEGGYTFAAKQLKKKLRDQG